jgi:hypothetical protein
MSRVGRDLVEGMNNGVVAQWETLVGRNALFKVDRSTRSQLEREYLRLRWFESLPVSQVHVESATATFEAESPSAGEAFKLGIGRRGTGFRYVKSRQNPTPLGHRLPKLLTGNVIDVCQFPLVGSYHREARIRQEGAKASEQCVELGPGGSKAWIVPGAFSPVIDKAAVLNLDHPLAIVADDLSARTAMRPELQGGPNKNGLRPEIFELIVDAGGLFKGGATPFGHILQIVVPEPASMWGSESWKRRKLKARHRLYDGRTSVSDWRLLLHLS